MSGPIKFEIENESGQIRVQLLHRYWQHHRFAQGRVQEVRGDGVVGEQPTLEARRSPIEYASGTPLPTPSGIMVGSYEMETAQGAALRRRGAGFLPRQSSSAHEA